MQFWRNKRVFITGGAGFIGHHLLSALIDRGAITTVGDNLKTGSRQNVFRVWQQHKLKYKKTPYGYATEHGHRFILVDFLDKGDTHKAFKDQQVVFHLAATIGGRGFIDTHPADCCENFAVNQNVFDACWKTAVERVQYASTACVYPFDLQKEYGSTYLLKEEDALKDGWANSDREYGWAKLMGELTLSAYHKQYGLKGSVTRYVTAYGPWENDTHAIIALTRRAVERKDPYLVWGSGKQDRDFTYVSDIVEGTIAACEKITDATSVNLGTGVRYTMQDVIETIFSLLGWRPKKIVFDRNKPEGVKTRALDISRAKKLLIWQPQYDLRQGLEKTIAWFVGKRPKSVETLR